MQTLHLCHISADPLKGEEVASSGGVMLEGQEAPARSLIKHMNMDGQSRARRARCRTNTASESKQRSDGTSRKNSPAVQRAPCAACKVKQAALTLQAASESLFLSGFFFAVVKACVGPPLSG